MATQHTTGPGVVHLIFSAPELYEACELLVAWDDDGQDKPHLVIEAVELARAAIQKAEGKG